MRDIQAAQIPLPFAMASIGLSLSYLFPASVHPVLATTLGFAIGVALVYFVGSLAWKENSPAGHLSGIALRNRASGNLATDQGRRNALGRALRADLIRILLEDGHTTEVGDIEPKLTALLETPFLREKRGRR